MKLLNLQLATPILILLLTSCNADSRDIQSIEQNQAIDNVTKIAENERLEVRTSTEIIGDTNDVEILTEWEPAMVKTPVSQPHKPFYLPKSNVQKIRAYFYDDINIDKVKGRQLDENDYELYGLVQYNDDTILNYSFDKEKKEYLGKRFALGGDYELSKDFSEFHKDIIYKMLDVSGVESPKRFFQELIDSPKITKYEGCTVQQKQAKYGMIELTSCELDDATALSLYNPELE